jgi:hypothetical protein
LEGAQVYIDGLVAGDAVLPDKAAIQEIRINQNPLAPEYDSMGLGRIELLTKAGTDAWHAQIFFNYGDALFNSRNPYATEKLPFTRKQYGGSLSVLINKKLSSFFDFSKRETAILSPRIVSETNFVFLHQADTTASTLEVENAFSGGLILRHSPATCIITIRRRTSPPSGRRIILFASVHGFGPSQWSIHRMRTSAGRSPSVELSLQCSTRMTILPFQV